MISTSAAAASAESMRMTISPLANAPENFNRLARSVRRRLASACDDIWHYAGLGDSQVIFLCRKKIPGPGLDYDICEAFVRFPTRPET
jgi:hypothetical protein